MTEIDTAADIDVVMHGDGVTIGIPLAGPATVEWCEHYQAMARRQNLPARAETLPARAWIRVDLPSSTDRQEVVATLDAARDLVAKADTTGDEDPAQLSAAIRDWWAGQRS
jgi:hypothetical protein